MIFEFLTILLMNSTNKMIHNFLIMYFLQLLFIEIALVRELYPTINQIIVNRLTKYN